MTVTLLTAHRLAPMYRFHPSARTRHECQRTLRRAGFSVVTSKDSGSHATEHFDLIVIGAGSGAEVSSAGAAHGWRVAVVESGPFGGTCLNRGCIPSKMLVHVADVARTVRRARLFGVDARIEAIDWDFIVERVFSEIDAEAAGIEEANRRAETIEVVKGDARFVGSKLLEVDGRRLTADTIVIAAGSRPSLPEIEGLDGLQAHTSDDVMRLERQPKRLLIIGGGYVAAELGHVFEALGTEVTMINRGQRLLSDEDDDISSRFTQAYARRFDLRLDAEVRRASRRGSGLVLEIECGGEREEVSGDALLVATGRVPNSDLLAVTEAGVEVDDEGFIRTDAHLQTNVPGIWALGDIVGEYMLKHAANLEAAHVAHNILHPDDLRPVDYHAMPHAIFGSPQVGSVGLLERDAREQGVQHVVASYDYDQTAFGSSIEDHDGFVKVLADPATREILGCHILGADASTLIQGVANLIRSRMTIDVMRRAIFVHPALPEVVQRAFAELPVQADAVDGDTEEAPSQR
jgi:mycothione reductase